jgi:hypothetical protein
VDIWQNGQYVRNRGLLCWQLLHMTRLQHGSVRVGGSGFSVLASRVGEAGSGLAHVQHEVGGIVIFGLGNLVRKLVVRDGASRE